MPDSPPLLKRVATIVRHPEQVTDWEIFAANAQNFTAAEFTVAFQLCQEERRSHRLIVAGFALSVGLFLVACVLTLRGSFRLESVRLALPIALSLLALDAILVASIGVRIVLIDLAREPAWLAIWQQANARRTEIVSES